MPLLRKVALDVCDAKDGDFDLPDVRILTVTLLYCSNIHIQTPFFLKSYFFIVNIFCSRNSCITLASCISMSKVVQMNLLFSV